jgi:hypothetical protein
MDKSNFYVYGAPCERGNLYNNLSRDDSDHLDSSLTTKKGFLNYIWSTFTAPTIEKKNEAKKERTAARDSIFARFLKFAGFFNFFFKFTGFGFGISKPNSWEASDPGSCASGND